MFLLTSFPSKKTHHNHDLYCTDLPHSVHLSVPGIDLLEGEGYPEKPIQCSAFGNPTPRYYWTFEPFVPTQGYYSHENHSRNNQTIVAIGPQLTLDKSMAQNPQGKILETSMEFQLDVTTTSSSHHNQLNGRFHATRTLSGNYTCVATNQHGSSSSTLTINVFCKFLSAKKFSSYHLIIIFFSF